MGNLIKPNRIKGQSHIALEDVMNLYDALLGNVKYDNVFQGDPTDLYNSSASNNDMLQFKTETNSWEITNPLVKYALTSSLSDYALSSTLSQYALTSSLSNMLNSESEILLSQIEQGSATNGQFLSWDGSQWNVVDAPEGGSGGDVDLNNLQTELTTEYYDYRSFVNDINNSYQYYELIRHHGIIDLYEVGDYDYTTIADSIYDKSFMATIVDEWDDDKQTDNASITMNSPFYYMTYNSSIGEFESSSAMQAYLDDTLNSESNGYLMKIENENPVVITYDSTLTNLKYIKIKELIKTKQDEWDDLNRKVYIDVEVSGGSWENIITIDNLEYPVKEYEDFIVRYDYKDIRILTIVLKNKIENVNKLRIRTDSILWFYKIYTWDSFGYKKYESVKNEVFYDYDDEYYRKFKFGVWSSIDGRLNAIAIYDNISNKYNFLLKGYINLKDWGWDITDYFETPDDAGGFHYYYGHLWGYTESQLYKGRKLYFVSNNYITPHLYGHHKYYQEIGNLLYDGEWMYLDLLSKNSSTIKTVQQEVINAGGEIETNKRYGFN